MTRSFIKKCLCSFFCLGIFINCYSQTGSDSQNWHLSFGHEGYAFPGSWVPLYLTLKEPVPEGRLVLVRGEDTKDTSGESWELTHSGQFEFPVFIDEKVPSFTVKIYSSGILLAEQTFHPTERLFSGHAILASAIPATVRLSLSRMLYPGEPVLVLPVVPQRLPVSALSYDAITALVLSDPGPVLNPPQVTAMGEWIALGGTVILMDPLKGNSSMLGQLSSRFTLTGSESMRQLGLGTIQLVDTETLDRKTLADGNFWKKTLNIASIAQTHRLRPGLVFGKRFDVFQKESAEDPLNAFIVYIVVFWIIVIAGCGFFLKKRKISFAIGIIILLSIFIALQKNTIQESWNRGISMHIRELILPQNYGTLASINLYVQEPGDVSIFFRKSSPFTSAFSFASPDSADQGIIRFSDTPFITWFHAGVSAGMLLDSSDARTLRLTGFLPSLPGSGNERKTLAKLRRVEGNEQWLIPMDDGTWKEIVGAPPEIANDADWILHVSEAAPDSDWLVGFEAEERYAFGGRKWTGADALWITPERRQAQP